jgi:hypothetical protein
MVRRTGRGAECASSQPGSFSASPG